MAKRASGLVKLSGKLGDHVYVTSSKYGDHVRETPKAVNSNKRAEVLKTQHSRTKFLNNLASELNAITRSCYGQFRHSGFYHSVLKRFRTENLDNRYFLLLQLKGLNLNPLYPFHKLGSCVAKVRTSRDKLIVDLKINTHPQRGRHRANCYFYDVLLITWVKTDARARHARQYGEWIDVDGEYPEFEFVFRKDAGTVHWLLCLGQQLGINKKTLESFKARGVEITDAGTFDKKDEKITRERAANPPKKKNPTETKKEITRVKAKKWNS